MRQLLLSTISGLRTKSPDLAKSMKKYFPLIMSRVRELSRITRKEPVDLAQDFFLGIARADLLYNTDLYRYNKHLYEIEAEDGPIVKLTTPKYKLREQRPPFWINKESVDRVRKSSYDTYLYSIICQQYKDMLKAFFANKNGWRQISKDGKKRKVERTYQEVRTSDINLLPDSALFSEGFTTDSTEYLDLYHRLGSPAAGGILSICEEVLGKEKGVVSRSSLGSKKKVQEAPRQIIPRDLYRYGVSPFHFKGTSPVWVSV